MSMSCYLVPLGSIERICEVIASRDEDLVQKLLDWRLKSCSKKRRSEEEANLRPDFEDLIMRKTWPKKEPGDWGQTIEIVAQYLELAPRKNPLMFNAGYHPNSWADYRDILRPHVTRKVYTLLGYLMSGRPLRSKAIDFDGSLFGWLTADEVKYLHARIPELDLHDDLEVDDLDEFHESFAEALEHCTGKSLGLLSYAF